MLIALCGCGAAESHSPHEARRPAPAHEVGPHGGRLIELGEGSGAAELVFDAEARRTTVYLLQEDLFTPRPITAGDVTLDLVVRRPVSLLLTAQPLPHDPPGRWSRFTLAGGVPESIRAVEEMSGTLSVTIDGRRLAGGLHEERGARPAAAHVHPPVAVSTRAILPQLTVFCLLIVAASFGGGWLPSLIDLTHTRMQFLISLVGGLMLGIGLLHLFPHAVAETRSVDVAARWAMVGLLTMFFLIRAFHFHQHGVAEVPTQEFPGSLAAEMIVPQASAPATGAHDHDGDHDHDHDGGHDHDHDDSAPLAEGQAVAAGRPAHDHHRHAHAHGQPHALSWIGVAVGLGLHTAIDGMVLAASMQADAAHLPEGSLFGLAPFVAIVLHKPLDAVSITSLMKASGWTRGWRNLVNAGFALMCPLGAALFLLGLAQLSSDQGRALGAALAFSAGVFLCISLGDLLPELEFHSHHRVRLSVALLIGIFVAWALGYIEPAHLHGQ